MKPRDGETPFERLSEAVANHLQPVLENLGFREVERHAAWYGGGITFARGEIALDLTYDIHDMGLQVELGTHTEIGPGPEYHLYAAALDIPTEEFKEACGGFRPGWFVPPDLDKGFAFVAATLSSVLPHQETIQNALREQPARPRQTTARRKKKPGNVPSD